MRFFRERANYLFQSTRGLVLVAIAMISICTALLGTLSGPMEELGVKSFLVNHLGLRLAAAEREGRIIMVYHAFAMAVVAIEVYLITALLPLKTAARVRINGTITAGYLTSMICGLIFAYFGRNWAFHGLFLFGQSLVFFAGLMLAAALWPWSRDFRVRGPQYAHTPGGLDLERAAFFAMAVTTLISVLFGAVPGSFFGNGFESFLAEDVVRFPVKTSLEKSVIGHLHIMLALLAVAAALIVGRWLDFKGAWHKFSMPLMIAGSIVLSMGTWFVVPFEGVAHTIIYGGSTLVLVAALFLVIFGWGKLIRERLAEQGITKPSFGQKLAALVHDPLKFGALWQMVFMNFTVSFIGIFMAVRLDKIIRRWPFQEERIVLTGHWHILAGIIATILLLYYADLIGMKGRLRQWFGWLVIVSSDLAFAAVTVFEGKRLLVDEIGQQPLVDATILLADIGLGVLILVLAALMFWRLFDLFRSRGRWKAELDAARAGEAREVEP